MIVALLLVSTLVVAGVAAGAWARARRTRRQTVDALAMVPELAGVAAPGAAERMSATATALSVRLGVNPREAEHVAAAARLQGLADLGAGEDGVARARVVTQIATESGLSPSVTGLLNEVLTTSGGRAGRAAAAVRVAATFERKRTEPHVATAGALFATVSAHGAGNDRRAAAELVALMQEGIAPA
ncbi:MAG TPA: hypothetical protein VM938_10235 [Acidimicrobiales bacterium]|nr:hypothetical protein [Acidimicrobiales bacterium]